MGCLRRRGGVRCRWWPIADCIVRPVRVQVPKAEAAMDVKLAARFTFVPGLFIGGSITYQRGEPEK